MDERVDSPQAEIRQAPLSRGPAPPVVRRSRARAWFGLVVVLLVALGGAYWFLHRAPQTERAGAGRNAETAPQPVGAETVGTGDIRIILNELGTVTPLANVTVKTQINGQLVGRRLPGRPERRSKATSWRRSIRALTRSRWSRHKGRWRTTRRCLLQAQTDLKRYQTLARQDFDRAAAGRRSALPGRRSTRVRCRPTRRRSTAPS